MKKILKPLTLSAALVVGLIGCQKMDRPELGDFPQDAPGSGTSMAMYVAMEGSELDSVRAMRGTVKGVTFEPGINGRSMKGKQGAWISYPSPKLLVNDFKDFSVSLWVKTQKHDDGAECVFMWPRTNDFWGNMFLMFEGNGSATDNSMFAKFHFAGQWIETGGANRIPNFYGDWKHLVFTYSSATSKFQIYYNGTALPLPASITDRTSGGAPLGKNFNFQSFDRFIIAGFQQYLGSPWGSPDGWMKNFRGQLDQFRLYKVALSPTEVKQLFDNKQ